MAIKKVNQFYVPANDVHVKDWEAGKPFTQNKCLQLFVKYCKDKNKKFKNILDIGAWVGTWAIEMQDFCTNKIYAYEPDPIHFQCLQKNIGSNIIPKQVAIGANNGQVSLSTGDFTQGKRVVGQGNIEMLTVDSLNLTDIDLIKIDVEGYEMEVLKGAIKTMKQVKYLMIELNNNTKKYGSSNNQIERYLRKNGFKVLLNHWPDKVFVKK